MTIDRSRRRSHSFFYTQETAISSKRIAKYRVRGCAGPLGHDPLREPTATKDKGLRMAASAACAGGALLGIPAGAEQPGAGSALRGLVAAGWFVAESPVYPIVHRRRLGRSLLRAAERESTDSLAAMRTSSRRSRVRDRRWPQGRRTRSRVDISFEQLTETPT